MPPLTSSPLYFLVQSKGWINCMRISFQCWNTQGKCMSEICAVHVYETYVPFTKYQIANSCSLVCIASAPVNIFTALAPASHRLSWRPKLRCSIWELSTAASTFARSSTTWHPVGVLKDPCLLPDTCTLRQETVQQVPAEYPASHHSVWEPRLESRLMANAFLLKSTMTPILIPAAACAVHVWVSAIGCCCMLW